MMGLMTTQQLLPLTPAGAVLIGDATALLTDEDGGRVFIRGELCFVWDAGDDLGRRLAAVQLVRIKAATAMAVATAFGVTTVTLWRWRKERDTSGAQGLAQDKRGPKGPSRLTPEVVADIRSRRRGGASLRAIAAAVGVSTFSVRRALIEPPPEPATPTEEPQPGPKADLPVLPAPAGRDAQRAAARWGKLTHADPVFAPAARVPLAGLMLAIPALEATGLLSCATTVFGCLRSGFYGLDTMLVEGVLRALAGQPRAEGSTRVDPAALGRVLGLDRAPEVKTIRRNITALAATGRADELLAAMAAAHVARLDASNPALFAHMDAQGFDVLTWRKGLAEDVDPDLFTDLTWLDETGRGHQWRVADTTVDLTIDNDEVFTMRQVTLLVANNKTGRGERGQDSTRQIHILTTRCDLPVEQVIYRMGSRWRQESYFRYARMHFDLDSHDAYATTDDDPTRLVPNPAKKKAHQQLLAARARYGRALAATDAALLETVSQPPGVSVLITNAEVDRLTTDLRAAESNLDTAQAAHRAIPARLPLAQVNPGQQVLDIQTKLISHAIRIAAFNTATALARAIRVHTGYARANHEAHTLVRQALTGSGDIDPGDGTLTIRLDPLPTQRATTAIAQLCEHLTTTHTHYPGTNLILRYEVKDHP